MPGEMPSTSGGDRDQVQLKIRQGYRALAEKIEREEDEIVDKENRAANGDEDVVKEIANRANELYQKVKAPQEAILDANVVKTISRIVRRRAEGLSTNVTQFNSTEYVEKLINGLHGSITEDGKTKITAARWKRFGLMVEPMLKRPPTLNYLFGAVENVEVVKKERKQRQRKVMNLHFIGWTTIL